MSDDAHTMGDIPADAVAVEVPASSANLGPGFDALAVALDVTLTVWTVERAQQRVLAEGAGADELPSDDGNLIWRGVEAYCALAGVAVPDVSLRARNEIPLERGMGSSAAAATAGAALGRALCGGGASDEDLIDIAAGLEGHPDNAAAAVLGGLVLCHSGRVVRLEPTPRLRPVVCVPQVRQSTATARGVLPEAVQHAQAAANGARTAAVVAGLTGLAPLTADAMTDVLHEPPRFAVMPETGRLVGALRRAGLPAALSGAGPSVLAVVGADDDGAAAEIRALAGPDWSVEVRAWHLAGAVACPPHA